MDSERTNEILHKMLEWLFDYGSECDGSELVEVAKIALYIAEHLRGIDRFEKIKARTLDNLNVNLLREEPSDWIVDMRFPKEPDSIGEMIRKRRKYAGMTQQDLADAAGISVMSVRRYETGERTPNVEVIRKIAKGLKASPSDFLYRGD